MNLLKPFEFSLEDIEIAKAMESNAFRDRAHRIESVSREYQYKKNMKMEKITLYVPCKESEAYEGKYFLQDIAYEWKKRHKTKNDLLLFIDESSTGYRVVLISTFDCFNPRMSSSFSLKKDGDGKFNQREVNKLLSSIQLGSFLCSRVIIFSKKEVALLTSALNRIPEKFEEVKTLSHKEIRDFFNILKPIKKSSQMRNFYFVSSFVAFLLLFFVSNMFDNEGVIQEAYNKKITSVEQQKQEVLKETSVNLRKQEDLFMRTSNNLKIFNRKEGLVK